MKTPQLPAPALAAALGFSQELWLKREDLHHHGSHKGRSIPLMIDEAARFGTRNFAVSSSGNAALSAAITVENHNKSKPADPYRLDIWLSPRIEQKKITKLRGLVSNSQFIKLHESERPQQDAFQFAKNDGVKLLRQSTDETALRGYLDLAKELARIPGLAAVFIPASSGTTAEGLYLGWQKTGVSPALHIVQTTFCHPLVDAISGTITPAGPERSLAGAIVDRVAHRRTTVALAVKTTGGAGWIVSNEELTSLKQLVKQTLNLDLSPNGLLALAGFRQALKKHRQFNGPVACIITGE